MKPHIGQCLKKAIGIKTNKQLAEHFNTTVQQVSIWKSKPNHSFHRVCDFADFFGLTLEEFLSLNKENEI